MNEAPDPASTSRGTPKKEKNRPIQTLQKQASPKSYDMIVPHWTSTSTTYPLVTVYNKYLYDWVGRKTKTWEQITNKNLAADTMRLVSNTNYNEIGQLNFKKLDSKDSTTFMQTISYFYNERGWLLQATAPLFNMVLSYNADANKAYNGNIMYQFWGVPGNLSNHYTYKYDKLNRLTSGVTSADNYQESGITYDTQGNLTALNRYSNGTEIDQLSYSYTVSSNPTNQLQSVADANASNSGLVSGTTNYTYDGNGNMLAATNSINSGQNKGITYNILNLPNVVTVLNGTDTYTYDATGNKLRMVSVISGVTRNTDYIGGIQYNGSTASDTLSFIQTEEGKAVPNGTTNYDYNYFLGDNLGNTRVTFGTKTGAAVVYQQDDYYPFGMEILRTSPVPNPKNEYLYNKKELQEDFTEYDYGARFYDPVIGRWTSVDPKAEQYRRWSPYNYVEDDPLRLTDPDGMGPDSGKVGMGNGRGANPAFAKCKCDGNPDLSEIQENADKTVDAAGDGEMFGIGLSAAGGEVVGAPIIAGSAIVGTAATVVSAGIDAVHGHIGKALVKVTALSISEMAGGAIKSSTANKEAKLALNAGKNVADKVFDKLINMSLGHVHEKPSTTMQRSSIPKPIVPKLIDKKKKTTTLISKSKKIKQ